MLKNYFFKTMLTWLFLIAIVMAQPTVSITSPMTNTSATPQTPITITATALPGGTTAPINSPYLQVNIVSGWRKLKLGYSSTSLWSPIQNVSASGNNKLEITVKVMSGTADWSKLQVRPQGSTASPITLGNYIATATDMGDGWKKLSIPLSAFASGINFAQLTYMEIPYSVNASACVLGISKIVFTGGTTPFEWFGPNKNNNYHNGATNDADVLTTSVISLPTTTPTITKVEFLVNNNVVGEDTTSPYAYTVGGLAAGSYQLSARATNSNNQTTTSTAVTLLVTNTNTTPTNTTASIALTSPTDNAQFTLPDTIPLSATVQLPSIPPYFQITNNTSGWRKIRLGYTAGTLTSLSPKMNVIAGGNTTMELVLKNISNTVNWGKIQIRPQGFANAPLVNIGTYIATAENLDNGWFKVNIPLTAFYSGIDFTKLTFLEFYSNNAPSFVMGVRSIIFKGGTTPFEWFGTNKTDNAHTGGTLNNYNMLGAIIPAQSSVTISKVEFFANNNKIAEDTTVPYINDWTPTTAGVYACYAQAISNNTPIAYSDTISVVFLDATEEEEPIPANTIAIILQLDTIPTDFSIQKTPLRFNKRIAYSLTLDDGLLDAFTVAKPLFQGGTIAANNTAYPGLFYTDGCGNNQSFRAGISVFSVNNSEEDLHSGTNSTYLTWQQIDNLYENNWDIYNHSYNHASRGWNSSGQLNDPFPTSIYNYQVTANAAYIQSHTTNQISTTHFIVPSGDDAYYQPALSNQMKAVYNQSWQLIGGSGMGVTVGSNFSLKNLVMNRVSIEDNMTNINNALSNINSLATEQNPIWYNEFTHNVGSFNGPIGGGLQFNTFRSYMQNIADVYGKNGSDVVWFAPLQEVCEYLQVEQAAVVSHAVEGNQVRLLINLDSVATDLLRYALTLKVSSSANINSIAVEGDIIPTFTFKGTGSNKLINLSWDNRANSQRQYTVPPREELPEYTADHPDMCQDVHGCEKIQYVAPTEELTITPNPADNYIVVNFSAHSNSEVALRIYDTSGKLVGFRKVLVFEGQSAVPFDLYHLQLPAGSYLLKVESANTYYGSAKFVKQ